MVCIMMVELAERFRLAEIADSGKYVWDTNFLMDNNDLVEIRPVGKNYSLLYACINRDQGRKTFERVRPPNDTSSEPDRLYISQRTDETLPEYKRFADFEIVEVWDKEPFAGWHHRDGYNKRDVLVAPLDGVESN